MKLHLAPMEGVNDFIMREILTSLGGIDSCVSEFIRITNTLISNDAFYQNSPELKTNSKTLSGTPVHLQLLGSDPVCISENVSRGFELGANIIDLNFGCPARTVNNHGGGASLLKTPEQMYNIIARSKNAVPTNKKLSAKIRLGFLDTSLYKDILLAVENAGADFITIHARTKLDAYKAPAKWEYISQAKALLKIPIIANGDITDLISLNSCKEITGCSEFMIGRGALQNPFLFQQLKHIDIKHSSPLELIVPFYFQCKISRNSSFAISRTKQWLNQLRKKWRECENIFNQIKIHHNEEVFENILTNEISNTIQRGNQYES